MTRRLFDKYGRVQDCRFHSIRETTKHCDRMENIPSVCSRTISLHTQFLNELGKIKRSIFCSMAFYRTTQPLSLANDQAPHSLFLTFIIIYSDKQTKWSSLHSLVNYSISFYFTIKLNPITTMRLICKILCVSQPFINQTYFILHASMRN